ncbi:acyltransferase family protein [Sphingomonas aracearum]|uniref:Acyltransferase n=1 Tax=Sphingomonas aracearum TaxID=2283317 RepID=A0A369VW57_9SPHN|nr:acyltransferase [Sphingomonas aracearum]RDE05302.1 acyltransferase [Sphingomonas aracearum]
MTSAARKPPRDPIYGLDFVRFIAALLVVLYHLGFSHYDELVGAGVGPVPLPAWWQQTWFGWIGVQIFFVISGLVIAYSLEGATRKSFIQSRIARLWPAMLICATLAAAVQIGVNDAPVGRTAYLWLKGVLFAPFGPWIAGQIWTLPIEIVFYALMCVVAVGHPSRLVPLAWALALCSAGYWLAVAFGGFVDTHGRLTQLVPLQHGCYFALGMAISWCH